MAKKNKGLLVFILILLFLFYTQYNKKEYSMYDYSSLSSCQSSQASDTAICKTDCVEITDEIVTCLDGYHLTSSDMGEYSYFAAPFDRTCSESDSKATSYNGKSYSYKTIRECMESGDSGECTLDNICSPDFYAYCCSAVSHSDSSCSTGVRCGPESQCSQDRDCGPTITNPNCNDAMQKQYYKCENNQCKKYTENCPTGQTCENGKCVTTCPSETTKCPDGNCKADCSTTAKCPDGSTPELWQDVNKDCKTKSIVWIIAGVFGFMMLMMMMSGMKK